MSDVTSPQIALKQPGESLVYSMDFVNLLHVGETIEASDPAPVVTSTPTGDPNDLSISTPSVSDSIVSFRIEKGRDKADYRVQVEIETSLGNTRIGDGLLQVRDK
jgi:hypothetical protein